MSLGRSNQKGSILSFIIIGVILASIIFSGIYFLRKHSEQIRHDKIIASIEKDRINTEMPKNNSSSENANTSDAGVNSTVLPETGTRFDIVRLLGVCLLSTSITSYMISRRNLQISRL